MFKPRALTYYCIWMVLAAAGTASLPGCAKSSSAPVAPALEQPLNLDVVNASPDDEALFLQNAGSDPRVGNRAWEGIPSVAATADGKQIYVAWYSGGMGEGPGNYVTVSFSKNNAASWMHDALVVYPRDPSQVRMYDPALWRDKLGGIQLSWTKSHQFWDGMGGVWSTALSWNGKTVEPGSVTRLASGVMLNKPVYIESQEAMLYPVSWWATAPSNPINSGTFIYRAVYKNGTKELEMPKQLSRIVIPDSIRTYDEHQVVQVSGNGNLLCLVRTWAGVYYARSTDYGEHWTKPAPFTISGPTTPSRFHISKLQSGHLLLIINNSTTRTNLTAFLSTDGGKNWRHRLLLDSRANVSYPDAIQTSDGAIHVVYDRDRFSAKDILYCRFTENDILHANTAGIYRSRVDNQ